MPPSMCIQENHHCAELLAGVIPQFIGNSSLFSRVIFLPRKEIFVKLLSFSSGEKFGGVDLDEIKQ